VLLESLQQHASCNVYACKSTSHAVALIERKLRGKCRVFVITNGADGGDEFCRQVRAATDSPILVFCWRVEKHRQWANTIENVRVTNQTIDVHDFVNDCLASELP